MGKYICKMVISISILLSSSGLMAADESSSSLIERAVEECGISKFKEKKNHPSCGVASFKRGTGAACGVISYKTRHKLCGVKRYKQGHGRACGYNNSTRTECKMRVAGACIGKKTITDRRGQNMSPFFFWC